MSEFPKRIQVEDKNWQEFLDAVYFHERERLGMPKDLLMPDCPICLRRKVFHQEETAEATSTPPQPVSQPQLSESLEEVQE